MKNAPTLYSLGGLIDATNSGCQTGSHGRWAPTRPMGFYSIGNRLRCAWMVFTGRADAVTWPGDQ